MLAHQIMYYEERFDAGEHCQTLLPKLREAFNTTMKPAWKGRTGSGIIKFSHTELVRLGAILSVQFKVDNAAILGNVSQGSLPAELLQLVKSQQTQFEVLSQQHAELHGGMIEIRTMLAEIQGSVSSSARDGETNEVLMGVHSSPAKPMASPRYVCLDFVTRFSSSLLIILLYHFFLERRDLERTEQSSAAAPSSPVAGGGHAAAAAASAAQAAPPPALLGNRMFPMRGNVKPGARLKAKTGAAHFTHACATNSGNVTKYATKQEDNVARSVHQLFMSMATAKERAQLKDQDCDDDVRKQLEWSLNDLIVQRLKFEFLARNMRVPRTLKPCKNSSSNMLRAGPLHLRMMELKRAGASSNLHETFQDWRTNGCKAVRLGTVDGSDDEDDEDDSDSDDSGASYVPKPNGKSAARPKSSALGSGGGLRAAIINARKSGKRGAIGRMDPAEKRRRKKQRRFARSDGSSEEEG